MADAEKSDAVAKEIYQDLLDRISNAYAADDFDAYARMIRVPHEVHSLGPEIKLETQADLHQLFQSIRAHLTQIGATAYLRTCVSAKFTSETEIVGTHETRVLMGSQVLDEPYPVKSHLNLIDGVWWVCKSDNAIEPEKGMGRAIKRNLPGGQRSA